MALVVGLGLSLGAARLAAQEAAPEAEAEEKVRLAPVAQQFIEAAKARLEAERLAQMEQELERQRQKAQKAAIQAAREQMKAQAEREREAIREREFAQKREAEREREAERQVALAREHQSKALYQRGQTLYRQGSYQEAIETLEQMVVMIPEHPLVKAAQRLIARADLKRFEQRLRASAELPPGARGAVVAELEDLLMHKRIELQTLFGYARVAIRERRYDTALKLLTAVLVQDPSHRHARKLMEQVQLGKIRVERKDVITQVERDEAEMINEVLKAQIVPESPGVTAVRAALLTQAARSAIAGKLLEPISFEFNQVALSDVLEFLADAASVSIIPSPALDLKQQRVTLKVKDMPLEQAVKYLAKSLSLAYRVDQDAILIATPEEFSKEPMQTQVYFLRHGLSPFALETAALVASPLMGMDSIKDLILQSIPQPPDSRLVVDERSGGLIVTNTRANHGLTQELLSQLDVTPVQVFIEARFVELTLTDLDQSGFEWLLNSGISLTKKAGRDGTTRGPGHEIASGGGSTFAALTREDEGLNLTLEGILTGTQFEAVLHLLEESRRSKTLSAPRVTTLNNQTATIRVVDEFRYPTRYEVSLIQFDINGDGDFDDAGETEFANVPQDIQTRDIGILLHVTPSVGKDLRTITLVLSPEVSQFSQFRNLGGGVTVPEFTSSQLTTSVLIEAGQTVVLGGLMTDTTTEALSKVPLLGDLPLLGGLFRQWEETNTRRNLLIFITARVLGPGGPTT